MNIYVVIENQFPEAELIMICACNDEEQAITAYRRLWGDTNSQISACKHVGECISEVPYVMWKNFITPNDKNTQNEQESSSEEESTEGSTTS